MRCLAITGRALPAVLGLLTACAHMPSAGDREESKKAADLLGRVKQHYIDAYSKPQRITYKTRTTTRTVGQPDRETIATFVTVQDQGQQRTEMTESEVITHPLRPGEPTTRLPGGKMVSVRDGGLVSCYFEAPSPDASGEPIVWAWKVDESKLSPEVAALYAGPLATLKLFDIVSSLDLRLEEAALHGREVLIVETVHPFMISQNTEASIQFWIRPDTLWVDRMEMDFEQKVATAGTPAPTVHGGFEADFTYETDVGVSRTAFQLELPPGAKDITAEVEAGLKASPIKPSR